MKIKKINPETISKGVASIVSVIVSVIQLAGAVISFVKETPVVGSILFVTTLITICTTVFVFRYLRMQSDLDAMKASLCEICSRKQSMLQEMHQLIHIARDGIAKMLEKHSATMQEIAEANRNNVEINVSKLLEDLKQERKCQLELLVQRMLIVFKKELPYNVSLWGAIRELTPVMGENRELLYEYKTILRVGDWNADREISSELIAEEAPLPKRIKNLHAEERDGMLIVGMPRPEWWPQIKNDKHKEDVSIFVAPGFKRLCKPDGEFDQNELTTMLFINSPQTSVFRDEHRPLMKCFADILSGYINLYTRLIVVSKGDPHG